MKLKIRFEIKQAVFFAIATLLVSSCVSLKKVKYIQDIADYQKDGKIEFFNETSPDYKVQPGDFLYVDVNSLDASNANPFESNRRAQYQQTTEMSVYLNSYVVADSGYVNFPLVGKIQVAGLTVNEIKTLFQDTINDYFQMTVVTVKLVNFKVSLLGEVMRPGTYQVYQESINILQAIAMAGDLAPYAKRDKIKVIRKTPSGSTVYTIDLLKANILESPAYLLQPDDIVYVEPLNSKSYAFTAFPYTLIFATITTTLLIMSYIK
jgi:polysaccharide export outer membrane protein